MKFCSGPTPTYTLTLQICSAEQLTPGEHVISIRVNAPAQTGAIANKVHVASIGSFDPNPATTRGEAEAILPERRLAGDHFTRSRLDSFGRLHCLPTL